MPGTRSRPSTADSLAGMALLQRFSVELNEVARNALPFPDSVPNVDIQLLSRLHGAERLSPTEVAHAISRPRSTTSRSIARLTHRGLIERDSRTDDGRRADLSLTAAGREQVTRFASSLGDFFVASRPVVKEFLLLTGHDDEAVVGQGVLDPLEMAWLLSEAGGRFVEDVEPVAREFGVVGAADRFALVLVAHRGQVRPSQLVDELVLTPPGVSSLLDRLAAAGLVTRHQGVVVEDGRGVIVRLTRHGTRSVGAFVRVFRHHQDSIAATLGRVLEIREPGDSGR